MNYHEINQYIKTDMSIYKKTGSRLTSFQDQKLSSNRALADNLAPRVSARPSVAPFNSMIRTESDVQSTSISTLAPLKTNNFYDHKRIIRIDDFPPAQSIKGNLMNTHVSTRSQVAP